MTRGVASRLRLFEGKSVVFEQTRSPYDDYVDSFYLLQREFVDAVLGGQSVVQTPAENLRTLRCTFAAYRSTEEGRVVAIDEIQ